MADVLKQLSFTKELTDVLKVAFPGLAEIAQKTEYEITISNDRKGLRLSCYVGAPIDLESDQPANPLEIETIEIPVGEIEEGVIIEDQEKALIEKASGRKITATLYIYLKSIAEKDSEFWSDFISQIKESEEKEIRRAEREKATAEAEAKIIEEEDSKIIEFYKRKALELNLDSWEEARDILNPVK